MNCSPRLRSMNIRVQHSMGDENLHIPPTELWGYTSGTAILADDYFEHLLFCIECQSLVNQFIDVLDGLPPMNPNKAA